MKGQYGLLVGGEVRQNLWTQLGELQFWITNKRKTKCQDCKAAIEAGAGIRIHYPFHQSGFVCVVDARARILKGGSGELGYYRIDVMGNLGPAILPLPIGAYVFHANEVANSLVRMENGKPIKVE